MKRQVDVEEILTELQALAGDTTGTATVAVLACMDVVERHGRIADEAEIAGRLHVGEQPVEPEQPPLLVQHESRHDRTMRELDQLGRLDRPAPEPDRIGPRSWDRRQK